MLRIGDAERDAAAVDLGEHYVAGRLTLDELHERLDAVFAARTFGQLTRIMADLPSPGRTARAPKSADWYPAGWYPAGWYPAHLVPSGSAGQAGDPRAAATAPPGYPPQVPPPSSTAADRAGRLAAVSLLLLAMLIWLFTALLFAKHGFYHQIGPPPARPFAPPGP